MEYQRTGRGGGNKKEMDRQPDGLSDRRNNRDKCRQTDI